MRALAYGLGLSQVFVMSGVLLLYPETQARVYAYSPCVVNKTLQPGCGSLRAAGVGLGLPCMVVSVATAAFVMTTFRLLEEGQLRTDCPFSAETMADLTLWDALFWLLVAGVHGVWLLLALDPGEALAVCAVGFLLVHFLHALCQPPADGRGEGQPLRTSVHFLGCAAGLALAFGCVPEGSTEQVMILLLLAGKDYILGIGHVADRMPRMETVANCRLCYALVASLGTAGAYAGWHKGPRWAAPGG